MKRWPFLLAAVALICVLSPFRGKDVSKLRPAEWVYLSRSGSSIILETDMGDRGAGENLLVALEDLQNSAPGELFLETADYLLVSKDAIGEVFRLQSVLRPAIAVCITETNPNENTAAFLRTHVKDDSPTMREWLVESKEFPVLKRKEGRWVIIGRNGAEK